MIRRHVDIVLTPEAQREADARQLASRRVTRTKRACECSWCSSRPRSAAWQLSPVSGYSGE